jgi:2-polyprenyl-6-hydroxyphenyl methylase/3-demethylubiquinone-9 3-methyltransferase
VTRAAPETSLQEQAYFAKRAALWWDEAGPFWPLIKLNKLRIPYIVTHLCAIYGRDPTDAHPLTGLRILDIGCGGGLVSEALAQLGATVTGIDIVEANIATAQAHAAQSGTQVTYRATDVAGIVAEGQTYDVVLTLEVVEHVQDPAQHLHMCAGLVAPGGGLFLSTINRTLASFVVAIVGAEYILRLLPKGTHTWTAFVKPQEACAALEATGMTERDRTGVKLNPITKKFGFTRLMAVNYMMCWTRPQGK